MSGKKKRVIRYGARMTGRSELFGGEREEGEVTLGSGLKRKGGGWAVHKRRENRGQNRTAIRRGGVVKVYRRRQRSPLRRGEQGNRWGQVGRDKRRIPTLLAG